MFASRQQTELLRELEGLRARVAELERERARALRHDPVTGGLGAPAFRARLAEETTRARRYQRPLSIAVLAVEDLEAIEAARGFKVADELIAAVARRLAAGLRSGDLLGRTGPDELAVIVLDTPSDRARGSLERQIAELEQAGEPVVSGTSVAIGVAGLEREQPAEALLAAARAACREAQGAGGGRAALASAPAASASGPREAVEALAVALTERDRYTGEHSKAVIEMSATVARNLGLRPAEVERIRSAALLHDIGKVAIPDEILNKPGPLNDQEWALMREHPAIGERILSVLPGMGAVARIVRHEHERWDGEGYPDGLAGEAIPLGSRIIIVADTYHAITSDRPYRRSRSHAEALEELGRCSGSQFDPAVTAALIGCLYGQRQAGASAPALA